MANKLSGLVQRSNGYYYYRARVPADLRRICPEREKWVSLKTKDETEAKLLCHLIAAEKLREYATIRERHAAFLKRPSPENDPKPPFLIDRDEAIQLARAYLAEHFSSPSSRMTAQDYPDQYAVDNFRDELRANIGELSVGGDLTGNYAEVGREARNLLKRGGYDVPPGRVLPPDFMNLVRSMLIALNRIEADRLDGDFRDNPQDAVFADFAQAQYPATGRQLSEATVSSAISKFWVEEIDFEPKAAKTIVKYRAALNLLARFLGQERPLRSVKKDQLIAYRDTLMRMPSNYSKRYSSEETFETILEDAQRRRLPTMSFKTREIYISLMKRLFRWAAANDLISRDFAQGIKIGGEKTAGRNKRRSFTINELNKIFSAPVFTGCENDERGYSKPGPNRPKRSRYWVPLIALYTGMRMGEILQLTEGHVRQSPEGNHFFYLTDGFGEEDGDLDFGTMELKTFNSRREVPVHPVLVAMGFLEFVASKRLNRKSELFPEVKPAADGKKSTIFSKRFSRFLNKCGVKPDGNGNCFHMFRHTMRDAVRNCGITEEVADAVQGWARDQNVGRNYGSGFEADAIAAVWAQLQYKNFEYSHLIADKSQSAASSGSMATMAATDDVS